MEFSLRFSNSDILYNDPVAEGKYIYLMGLDKFSFTHMINMI